VYHLDLADREKDDHREGLLEEQVHEGEENVRVS